METKLEIKNLNFSDPRFEFGATSSFFWRLIIYSFYILFSVLTALFIFSDILWMKWVGGLFILFLIDRAVHFGQGLHNVIDLKANLLGGINVADYLSGASARILQNGEDKTLIVGGNYYLNLLKLLIKNKGIRGALWRLEISPEEFEQKIDEEILKIKGQKVSHREILEKIILITKIGFMEAYTNKTKFIEPSDLFAALSFVDDGIIKKIFYLFSIEPEDLERALIFSKYRYKEGIVKKMFWQVPKTTGGFAQKQTKIRHRIMNRAWTARPTPMLDKYGIDLTDLARQGLVGFLIGHKEEYEELAAILSRSSKQNALLLGEPGSGKESIVNHLAFNITKDKVASELFDKRVVSLQIADLIAGAEVSEISERMNKIILEIETATNVILYIPDLHNLFKTSGEGFLTAADIMLPAIRGGTFQVIGASYLKEYKSFIEPKSDFNNSFEKININELSEDNSAILLTYESIILEKEYGVVVSFKAIKKAVELAHKYFKGRLLPASASDLLKETLAFITQTDESVLKSGDIISLAEKKINVPLHKTDEEEAEKLLNLENIIHKQLIDQEQAVGAVAKALREYRSGLSRQQGPIAAFLFVGPTGVGKTELAKILAQTQFGSEGAMVRFDMSEYQEKQSIYRFIGSPDGKVSGALTEAIVAKPYSLILLDEFEKAHSDVLNIFLQVFDDGRITDNVGRVVDFQNTIIIATSNANSDFIVDNFNQGKKLEQIKDEFKKKLTGYFRAELLNRFSDIIIFKNLSKEDIYQVAKLQLQKFSQIVSQNQSIILDFDENVINFVCERGFDPVFGARPLRTAISDLIKSELAEKILKRKIIKGDIIMVNYINGELIFNIKRNQ